MTFLELVQRLWAESGASGTSPGPSTVVGQTGEYARLVAWVQQAWKDIQRLQTDWFWMRSSASFTTVAGQATYALGTGAGTVGVAAADFGKWAMWTGRNYITAVGTDSEIFMYPITYDGWRDYYQYGALRAAQTRPIEFAFGPAKQVCLGPTPAAGYTVTLDYFHAPTDITVDTDEPDMPEQFHMIIVWSALMAYATYESAPEVYDRAKKQFDELLQQLDYSQLPEMRMGGGALA